MFAQVRLVLGVKAELDSTKEAVLRLYRRQALCPFAHLAISLENVTSGPRSSCAHAFVHMRF